MTSYLFYPIKPKDYCSVGFGYKLDRSAAFKSLPLALFKLPKLSLGAESSFLISSGIFFSAGAEKPPNKEVSGLLVRSVVFVVGGLLAYPNVYKLVGAALVVLPKVPKADWVGEAEVY